MRMNIEVAPGCPPNAPDPPVAEGEVVIGANLERVSSQYKPNPAGRLINSLGPAKVMDIRP